MIFMQLQQFVDLMLKHPALVSEKGVGHIPLFVSEKAYQYNFVLEDYLLRIK